jgi:hypothetical protein
MIIHGVCVGCTRAALSGPGVAVTTMIHGVCVGGGTVGSGVVPQPVSRPRRISSPASFLID